MSVRSSMLDPSLRTGLHRARLIGTAMPRSRTGWYLDMGKFKYVTTGLLLRLAMCLENDDVSKGRSES